MRNLIIVALFLVSCSKQQTVETDGISFHTTTKSTFYTKAILSVEPFCMRKLYTIKSQIDSSEELMISIVTDKLEPGSYKGGLTHWGKPALVDDITLNVVSFNQGVLNASFVGPLTSGIIKNIH